MAPATRRPQPQRGQESAGNSLGHGGCETRAPLGKRARGAVAGQRKEELNFHQQEVPGREGFLCPGIPGSWLKATPCMGHNIQDDP